MLKSTLATLALTLTGTPAALPLPPAPAVDIPVYESDLTDPASIDTLRTRIARAARDVCREQVAGDLLRSYTLPDCIDASRDRALAELDIILERQARGETVHSDDKNNQ